MPIRFQVEHIFEIQDEEISMVMLGHLLEGELTYPIVLKDEETNSLVKVSGYEMVVMKRDPEMRSLTIAKDSPSLPAEGMVLISST